MWDSNANLCLPTCSELESQSRCLPFTANCNWVPQLKVCRRICELIVGDVEKCAVNEQCEVKNGTCLTQCIYKYGSPDACNDDKTCGWNADTNTCEKRPCVSTDPIDCESDLRCEWNATGAKCGKGPCQWTDKSSCGADRKCEWLSIDNMCVKELCPSSLSQDECGLKSRCQWSDNTCVKKCNYLGTKSECAAADMCDWQLSGRCGLKCELRDVTTPEQCQSIPDCYYDTANDLCKSACKKRPTQDECGAFTVCVWTSGYCKLKCSLAHNSADKVGCQNDPTCRLYVQTSGADATYQCSEPCNTLNSTQCGLSSSCQMTNGSCTATCTAKYGTTGACNADPACVFDPKVPGCVPSCDSTLDQASCGANPVCEFSAKGCRTKCSLRHAGEGEALCAQDPNCMWSNSSSTSCVRDCDAYTPGDCPVGLCSSGKGQTCVKTCSQRFKDNVTCNQDGMCEWNAITGKCQESLCKGSAPEVCNATSACQWNGASCENNCTTRAQTYGCQQSPLCNWNAELNSCVKKCQYLNASECGTSQNPECATLTASAGCRTDCKYVTDENACLANPNCGWSQSSNGCRRQCSVRYPAGADGQMLCLSDPECTLLSDGSCASKKCQFTNQEQCKQDPDCNWNEDAKSCQVRPCAFWSNEACSLDRNCQWTVSVNSATCGPTKCPPTLNQQGCQGVDGCSYDPSTKTCGEIPCYYTSRTMCATNQSCAWNVTTQSCQAVPADECLYTDWSAWSSCDRPCAGGKRTSMRSVIKNATDGAPCTSLLQQTESCNQNVPCECSKITSGYECVQYDQCQYIRGKCRKINQPCAQFTAPGPCDKAAEGCLFVAGKCVVASMDVCFNADVSACSSHPNECDYIQPQSAASPENLYYQSRSTTPITLFEDLTISNTLAYVDGAAVYIEGNYSRDMDYLYLNASTSSGVVWEFYSERGMMIFEGQAPASVYQKLLQQVQYFSTSAENRERRVSWSVGKGVLWSSKTGHMYKFFNYVDSTDALTWWQARTMCQNKPLYGMTGYLATLTETAESSLVNNNLVADGWICGTDVQVEAMWRWVCGPESLADNAQGQLFWIGKSAAMNGTLAPNASWANWAAVSDVYPIGQPTGQPGKNFAVIRANGVWADATSAYPDIFGYLCEWGAPNDLPPQGTYGTTEISLDGCTALPCKNRGQDTCQLNPECLWDTVSSSCIVGCSYASEGQCLGHSDKCNWDPTSVPSRCVIDVCKKLSVNDCLTNGNCTVENGVCVFKRGCEQYAGSTACTTDARCDYDNATGACGVAPCSRHGTASGACTDPTCVQACLEDSVCSYFPTTKSCSEKPCNYLKGTCEASTECEWASPPGLSYSPGNPPLTLFPDAAPQFQGITTGVVFSIVGGFKAGDTLVYTGDAEMFSPEWSEVTGTLTVVGLGTSSDLPPVIGNVTFVSSAEDASGRNVSWVVLGKNFKQIGPIFNPTNAKFIEFVPSYRVTYMDAKATCEGRTLHGVRGELATFGSFAEYTLSTTALGSHSGWIGAKGIAGPDGSVWSWSTPSNNRTFFTGTNVLTNSIGFSRWGANQPTKVPSSSPLYGMLMADGSWRALDPRDTSADGFYCTYIAPSSGSTSAWSGVAVVQAAGCIPKLCSSTVADVCKADPRCQFTAGQCSKSPCATTTDPAACNRASGCYFDPSIIMCTPTPTPPTACTAAAANSAQCGSVAGCEWTGAACLQSTCSKQPSVDSCGVASGCSWTEGSCVRRLCGATTRESCIADPLCNWTSTGACTTTQCIGLQTAAQCTQDKASNCRWTEGAAPPCNVDECPWSERVYCNADPKCVWDDSTEPKTCNRAVCLPNTPTSECENTPGCGANPITGSCQRDLCMITDPGQCNNDTSCTWDNTTIAGYYPNGSAIIDPSCRARSLAELDYGQLLAAAEGDDARCKVETKNYLGLILGLCGVVLLLVIAIVWLWKRQQPDRAKHFNVAEQLKQIDDGEGVMMMSRSDMYQTSLMADEGPASSSTFDATPAVVAPKSGLIGTGGKPSAASGYSAPAVPAPRVVLPSAGATAPASVNDEVFDATPDDDGAPANRPAGPVKALAGVRAKTAKGNASPRRKKAEDGDDPFTDAAFVPAQPVAAAPPPPAAAPSSAPPPPAPPISEDDY